ncbi:MULTISPECIES: 23S rRNA (adenine(2503)-C(2))-methyltransferase RlmN [Petrimonas]|uniref:Probable dual-specificity RNA methyltransferase RlmN n=1 Tax=Petrimonas mucosa TaxID=1642646 RepID=A0A1G4GB16_9BACT|nr:MULTISPECIES: 23S rRNA (adenine(2503)-C(2))-methyltransferase RlmN [Petrimonas]MDD3561237.1 23S rRNA (adenine(2503)-C(2))-methyltransferase RlmN [Petrimonas mucosa]SCM59746.1 putative dual-specificity RNA methyltransferase RlmN {ECO:0000255/HAMAP-Rule:MF_01849} [Petrimonas mucosa]SFU42509.1 23S rRNA m(2)A-2503 methyltransferase [Porphyromonadaceae bacterium KHP3R9]HHT30105.1 23S rRNA (adenine(2503)-C(2))-methyltransferase RlmN [Petrimonas mucosa]
MNQQHLLGMTLTELQEAVTELGLPKYAARQIADWVYVKRVRSIDEMTNISVRNRDILKKKFDVGRVEPVDIKTSVDGTQKMLFPVKNGKFIESVNIPEDERLTICVSSQVGCKMNCSFCMTGRMGFLGSLSANEILNQVYSVPNAESITNLVFMGMGEPLNNYDNVMKAIELLTADYGLAWSPKRITLSTIGVIPNIRRFLAESKCHLAISLHSPVSSQRETLMPIEKTFKAADIIELLREHDWSHQRRLSFEYIMFDGLNDSLLYARELSRLLAGLDCRVNLIRFHKIPDSDLSPSTEETMVRFRDFLTAKGFTCTIRASRGEDIYAACGMLSTAKI